MRDRKSVVEGKVVSDWSSDVLLFRSFGSSGDLTKRLLIPALYNLAKAGRLSDKFALIGVDRTDRSHEEFRAYLAEGVRSFVSDTGTGPVTAPFDARSEERRGGKGGQ